MAHAGSETAVGDEGAWAPRRIQWLSFALGTLLVSGGCTAAVTFAFRDRVSVVFVGLASFVIGYRILQRAHGPAVGRPAVDAGTETAPADSERIESSRGPGRPRRSTDRPDGGAGDALAFTGGRYVLQAIGVSLMALGVTAFAQTVLAPDPIDALASGVYSLAGYVCTHVAVNFELL